MLIWAYFIGLREHLDNVVLFIGLSKIDTADYGITMKTLNTSRPFFL